MISPLQCYFVHASFDRDQIISSARCGSLVSVYSIVRLCRNVSAQSYDLITTFPNEGVGKDKHSLARLLSGTLSHVILDLVELDSFDFYYSSPLLPSFLLPAIVVLQTAFLVLLLFYRSINFYKTGLLPSSTQFHPAFTTHSLTRHYYHRNRSTLKQSTP